MRPDQGINHLTWRFKKGDLKANNKDLEALNSIIDLYNTTKERNISKSLQFTKLVVYLITKICEAKSCHPGDKRVISELLYIFQEDISSVLKRFTTELNIIHFNKLCSDSDLELDYFNGNTLEEDKEALEHTKKAFIDKAWKEDVVNSLMMETVNKLINEININKDKAFIP